MRRVRPFGTWLLLEFTKLGVASGDSHPVDTGDPVETARAEVEFWWATLQKVSELYLEPQGLVLDDVLEEIGRKYPEIEMRRGERLRRSAQLPSIPVDEHTPPDEAIEAFDSITAEHESRPRDGRPG